MDNPSSQKAPTASRQSRRCGGPGALRRVDRLARQASDRVSRAARPSPSDRASLAARASPLGGRRLAGQARAAPYVTRTRGPDPVPAILGTSGRASRCARTCCSPSTPWPRPAAELLGTARWIPCRLLGIGRPRDWRPPTSLLPAPVDPDDHRDDHRPNRDDRVDGGDPRSGHTASIRLKGKSRWRNLRLPPSPM